MMLAAGAANDAACGHDARSAHDVCCGTWGQASHHAEPGEAHHQARSADIISSFKQYSEASNMKKIAYSYVPDRGWTGKGFTVPGAAEA